MTAGLWIVRRGASEPTAAYAVLALSALLFAASTTLTIVWSTSMSGMGGMPMPGGWTMSMAWMRTPEQTWTGAIGWSLGMWVVMMVAMMLPSLVPMLWRYRAAIAVGTETRLGWPTAWVGIGYFFVWTLVGAVALPLGFAMAEAEMRYPELSRAVPVAVSVIVLIAGVSQFTAWKAHHLACCRESPLSRGYLHELRRDRTLSADARTAWQHGIRLGLHCSCCGAGLTAILLVMGVMDLRVMALVTTAITAERLAPAGERVARGIGLTVVGVGMLLLARAAGLQ